MFATSAFAAVNPTISLTAPTQVSNNNVAAPTPVTLTVTTTTDAFSNSGDNTQLSVHVPVGVPCGAVTLTPTNGGPAVAPILPFDTTGSCTFIGGAVPSQAASTTNVYNYDVAVNAAGTTGSLTLAAQIQSGGSTTVAASNTTTTAIVNPTAPAFNASPPPAVIYHNYSDQFGNVPFPAFEYVYGFGYTKDSSGIYHTITRGSTTQFIDGSWHTVLHLNPGFEYDATTGKVINYYALNSTNSVRPYTWIVVESNGTGGAASATSGVPGGTTAVPSPALAVHEVASPPVNIPVLFSDVAINAPLATEIYDLSDNGAITGYVDGTFRPGQSVTRAEFVEILYRAEGVPVSTSNGPCSTIHPSAFADVPNSSIFCQAIRDLSSEHIINGFTDGLFHPNALVTRGQITAFLFRTHAFEVTGNAFGGDATCTQPIPFNDVSSTNVFCGDIEWAAANHIANGYPDGGFHPAANASRAQVAAFIDRFSNEF